MLIIYLKLFKYFRLPLQNHFPQKIGQCENKFEIPILQCHGNSDLRVTFEWGQMSARFMQKIGFKNLIFKNYQNLSHLINVQVIKRLPLII